jgi:hypothetical protein
VILLSVVTPTIPRRALQLAKLSVDLNDSIFAAGAEGKVEHLILDDRPGERVLTVGEKRDRLIREARGKYVAFVDDDDAISLDYVGSILAAAEGDPDVITFLQEASIDGAKGVIEFRLGNRNEPFRAGSAGVIRRNAWHVCAWRRELAILSRFPAINYGEDWAWARPLCELEGLREVHVPRVLHYYVHSAESTAAPAPTGGMK